MARKRSVVSIEVRDFGPIRRAVLDLRPLTVLVGPSNTGKSYLAILVYAMHRAFRLGQSRPRRFHTDWLERLDETVGAPLRRCIAQFAEMDPARPPQGVELRPDILDLLMPAFLADGQWNAGEEISTCFGLDHTKLVRRGAASSEVVLRAVGLTQEILIGDGCTVRTAPSPAGSVVLTPEFDAMVDLCLLSRALHDRKMDLSWYAQASRVVEILRRVALPSLVSPLDGGAYYLPADRTGAVHAHSAVVSGLIGSAATAGPRSPLLSGVLADFLRELAEIDMEDGGEVGMSYARRVEESILDGVVAVRRDATSGYPSFVYRPTGWDEDLPIKNASSMVSEVAPIALFIRHRAAPGSLLIVEEPEAHLHPGMQVEFIRLLASLVKAGVRVLLTTHSEWVLEELSNIVLASRLPVDVRAETPAGDVALESGDVGVWSFQTTTQGGSVVAEVQLGDEDGLYSTDFSEVANETYNRWVHIGNLTEGRR